MILELWNGEGKGDSEDRLLQSKQIAKFVEELKPPYILAGDFNLNPKTKSFNVLTDAVPRDLIREFGITSTRSRYYSKPGKFADYILTSKNIALTSFEVLQDEVSDHLALRLVLHKI